MTAAEVPVGEQAAGTAGNQTRRNRFVTMLAAAAVLIIVASAAAVIALRWHQRDSLAGTAYLPAGQTAAWGRGIALVAKTLTP